MVKLLPRPVTRLGSARRLSDAFAPPPTTAKCAANMAYFAMPIVLSIIPYHRTYSSVAALRLGLRLLTSSLRAGVTGGVPAYAFSFSIYTLLVSSEITPSAPGT